MRKFLTAIFALAVAVPGLLAAPAQAEPTAPITSTNPTSYGDWDVGLHTFEIVDETREGRTLVVDMWYPIDPEATVGAERARINFLVADVVLNAFDDPAPAKAGNFPLVVFSHGNGGLRSQSWELLEVLASHGYVVVSPDHTGNTALDRSDPNVLFNRPRDISLLIDTVLEFDRTRGNQFHRTIDQRRIAVGGHSLGGFTALAMAGGFNDFTPDRRVDAVIGLAPAAGIMSDAELHNVKVPTLLMGGTSDVTTPIAFSTEKAWNNIRSKIAYRVDIEKGGHNSFTNVCEMYTVLADAGLPPALLALLEGATREACAPELIDIDNAHFLTYGYSVSFLDSTLGKQPEKSIILSQAIADYFHLPVEVSARNTVNSSAPGEN